MRTCLPAVLFLLSLAGAPAAAADQPYGHGDITLGASYEALAAALDFRNIYAAIAEQRERKTQKPDLGRRGYGCVRREDAYAEITCVSHDERIGGAQMREIRLQFLGGILQQFSITAELQYFEVVMGAVRARYGPPDREEPATAGAYASSHWRNSVSSIVGYAGKDLVFVSFELAAYADAVKLRQHVPGKTVVEPR